MDIQAIQRLLTDDSIELMISLRSEPYNTVGITFRVDFNTYGISIAIGKTATFMDKVIAVQSRLADLLLDRVIGDDSCSYSERGSMRFQLLDIIKRKTVL